MNTSTHTVVDAREQRCPMPLLLAKRGLRELASGEILEVLATDPGSVKDFQSLERLGGHQVKTTTRDDGVLCHRIIKA